MMDVEAPHMGFRIAAWLLVAFSAALLAVMLSTASLRRGLPRAQFLLVLALLLNTLNSAIGYTPAWRSFTLTAASMVLVAIAAPGLWRAGRDHLREVGLLKPQATKRPHP